VVVGGSIWQLDGVQSALLLHVGSTRSSETGTSCCRRCGVIGVREQAGPVDHQQEQPPPDPRPYGLLASLHPQQLCAIVISQLQPSEPRSSLHPPIDSHHCQPIAQDTFMENNSLRPSVLVASMLLCGLLLGCGSGTATPSSDPGLYISGYIMPINLHSSAIGSNNYYGWVIIDDVSGDSAVHVADAIVTINGQTAAFDTTYGNYLVNSITGTFNTGSTFTVKISHPRVALTETLTVPTSTIPASFTFNPLFDNDSNKTVQNTTYTITPTSAWSNFGSIIAYLYGTGTATREAYCYYSGLATGAQFSSTNLSYGTPAVLSQNISFAAWSEDQIDLEGFGFNGTSYSRMRVWAPYGSTIGQNF
jgi:hypothetical protein